MLTHLFRTTIGQSPGLVTTPRTIHVIGAGGNGAPMFMRLYKMHTTLRALGRAGLKVVLWDQDTVSQFNIGRQPFFPQDIGRNKASVLVDRLKMMDHTIVDWEARQEMFIETSKVDASALMVITCVDTKAARRAVHEAVFLKERALYWCDLGNEADTGQIVLGEAMHTKRAMRLPVITELYPSMLDTSIPEDNFPSCSTEEALEKQSLFVNEIVVGHAASMIWDGLFKGAISNPILYVNVNPVDHTVLPVAITKDFYKRKGIHTGRRANPYLVET